MADARSSDAPFTEKANELYWNSDLTVDEIVEDLGVGRNTLYSAIRPQSAGASCPECGKRLVYTNRSNRTAATGTCRNCDADVDLSADGDEVQVGRSGAGVGEGRGASLEDGDGWTRWRHELAAVSPERAAMIGGAAALGVMAGALAARAVREMG